MLHKLISKSRITDSTPFDPSRNLHVVASNPSRSTDPAASGNASSGAQPASSRAALAVIASRRCSAFFAEAAVLVLVFGILDYFMQKGRIELAWIIGALAISASLLVASILTDFSAHRWAGAHP